MKPVKMIPFSNSGVKDFLCAHSLNFLLGKNDKITILYMYITILPDDIEKKKKG